MSGGNGAATMTIQDALGVIEAAASPGDLFPDGPDAPTTQRLYRDLAKVCHPDKFGGQAIHLRVSEAFGRLTDFYERLHKPAPPPSVGKWEVRGALAKGSLTDLYQVAAAGTAGILKIAQAPADNPLLSQEARALKALHAKKEVEQFRRYFPVLLDRFEASGRAANVVSDASDCHTLAHIRSQFPLGVEFRHVVWMMNRLLSAIGAAHATGIIHGAVLPNHLLYRLSDHGMVLVDWKCAVQFPSAKGHIPLVVRRWQTHYPVEVRRRDAYCSTDLFMAARAMLYAAGGIVNVPRRFRSLLEWLTAESPAARPEHAWEVQDRWRKLAEEEYGKPTFVELALPMH